MAVRACSAQRQLPPNLILAEEPPLGPRNRRLVKVFEPLDLYDPATFELPVLSLTDPSSPAGSITLDDELFGVEPRRDILHRVVVWQLNNSNRRTGTYKAKNRAEVSGTGKKAFRQKGNGRARQGTHRAPHMRGGGRAFPPQLRSYESKLNKKVRMLGLKCALSARLVEGNLIIIEDCAIDSPKTKDLVSLLVAHGWDSALFIDGVEKDLNFEFASRNIQDISLLPAQGANVYDILRREKLILTREAVKDLGERLSDVKEERHSFHVRATRHVRQGFVEEGESTE